MTVSKDLMLAILSLDAYNQGYGKGINHGKTQIGSATVNEVPSGLDDSQWESADFYAVSYTLNADVGDMAADTKIISYRGTDNPYDVINGWVGALGIWQTEQLRMAAEFYRSVTGTTTTDPRTGNAILTGHSLGGGLAGFMAFLLQAFSNPPNSLRQYNPFTPRVCAALKSIWFDHDAVQARIHVFGFDGVAEGF